jgi:hypothetical protein
MGKNILAKGATARTLIVTRSFKKRPVAKLCDNYIMSENSLEMKLFQLFNTPIDFLLSLLSLEMLCYCYSPKQNR